MCGEGALSEREREKKRGRAALPTPQHPPAHARDPAPQALCLVPVPGVAAGRRQAQHQAQLIVRLPRVVVGVVLHGEAVVEQEARVALLAVAVKDLLPRHQRLQRHDQKGAPRAVVQPARLPRAQVVQHVRVRHQRVCAHAVHGDAKVARGHNHARPQKVLGRGRRGASALCAAAAARRQRPQLWHRPQHQPVVVQDVAAPVLHLLQQVAARQPGALAGGPEQGHGREGAGQDGIVGRKGAGCVMARAQQVERQVAVLGC